MSNLNRLKKRVQIIREDFEENNYYISPDSVITTDIYTENELFTINVIAELIAKDNLKTPLGKTFGISDIAKANGLTVEELNERILKNMAFVRDIN
jgi:hypothetical protein